MSRIKSVFFDAVGTLLFPHPSPATVYVNLARRHGAELDESLVRKRIWQGYHLQEEADIASDWAASEEGERHRWFSIVKHSLPEVAALNACFHDLWEHYRFPTAWKVHPEAAEVFGELRSRGIRVGLASNFDGRLGALVEALPELEPIRERCLISSLVGWRKPSPRFFAEVIRSAGCDPEEILFVGDDLRNDYHGAKVSGLRVMLLDPERKHLDVAERIESLKEVLTR